MLLIVIYFFFFQAEDGIRAATVTGVQTCALPISRGRGSARGSRDLPVSDLTMRVRDAMVPDPAALGTDSTAEDAGRLLAKPEVRAVFVCEGERLVGVVTRKTLVREVVAKGLDTGKTALREIAEEPHYTIESSLRLDEAFHFL